jgi:hypoxanthine phosphoribosyltransferase
MAKNKPRKKYTERSTVIAFKVGAIQAAVEEIANQVNRDYHNQELVLVPVLPGALMFAADLLRRLDKPAKVWVEAVRASRPADPHDGSLDVNFGLFADTGHLVKRLLVLEDVLDSGRTLNAIVAGLGRLGAAQENIAAAVLIRNELTQPPPALTVEPKYIGLRNKLFKHLVGYGIDYNGLHRNRPEIKALLYSTDQGPTEGEP